MGEEIASLFVEAEGDGFGAIDGGTAADGDDGVDCVVVEDLLGGLVKVGDVGVFFDVGECAGVVFGGEQGFDLLDEGVLVAREEPVMTKALEDAVGRQERRLFWTQSGP